MRIKVLGSAAGGGFPQWNCGCQNCAGLRAGKLRAKARTQESVAVSADGETWFLLGASPEIRSQIEANPILHPRSLRHSPIAGILLNNGDLDRCLGLLSLRESYPYSVYATDVVRSGFTEANVLYNTLSRFDGQVRWIALQTGISQDLLIREGEPSGLTVTAVPAPGKRPLHLGHLQSSDEDNVGFLIESPTRRLAYFASTGGITPVMKQAIDGADALFMDGTFWSSTELIDLGIGTRLAADMAHVPISGDSGSLHTFNGSAPPRRIYIHINNTNPILNEDSAEAALVREAGWQVAYDGMEFAL